jgi:RNA polymerase sigma-70 factor, ECF subfamily
VRKRERKEFEQACLEHLDALYSAALKLTGSKHDAEELVQNTYLKALRFATRFEWGTNLKAWLFRIQTNAFINDYRHKKHEHRYLERAATESIYDEVFDREARAYAANPETHAFTRFFADDLERALEDLPEDFRLVLILSDIEGFSYKEIADIIGCPIGTVMSRLHRGRKLLQRDLVDYAVEAGLGTRQSADAGEVEPANILAYRQIKRGQS